tara:strand:+ start:2099 stop:2488 length:390 start_codon:yes stop_codon:yes gene_type:complete
MPRKCGLCKKTGHDARTCPNKDKLRKAPVSDKQVSKPKKDKYPDYFYKNMPSWVGKLNNAKVETKPKIVGNNKRYCGNCSNLDNKNKYGAEPYCKKIGAAVRGQWWCSQWRKGAIQKVTLSVEGEDIKA